MFSPATIMPGATDVGAGSGSTRTMSVSVVLGAWEGCQAPAGIVSRADESTAVSVVGLIGEAVASTYGGSVTVEVETVKWTRKLPDLPVWSIRLPESVCGPAVSEPAGIVTAVPTIVGAPVAAPSRSTLAVEAIGSLAV